MINDAVRGYFGFERLPFDRSIPVGALFASASHQEAVGRIAYGIDTRQITVITGEVGAGKTVAARAAAARLDASRYQLITIPNPQVGARGIHHAVVTALGGVPRVPPRHLDPAGRRAPGRRARRARPAAGPADRRGAPAVPRPAGGDPDADQRPARLRQPAGRPAPRPAPAAGQHAARRARRPGPADRRPVRDGADDPRRDRGLPAASHQARRPRPTRCSPTTPPN